jgi:kynurenine formamidase
MLELQAGKYRVVDVTEMVIPPEKELGPDDISTRVRFESLVWPIRTYPSAIDHSVYQILQMKSHLTTHVEGPIHMFPSTGKPLSDFDAETFVGRAVILRFGLGEGDAINRSIFEKVDSGRLRAGDIAIVCTPYLPPPSDQVASFTAPVIDNSVAEYLIEKKVKMVGLDHSTSFYKSDGLKNLNAHDILLKNNIPLLEGLCNLSKLKKDISFLTATPFRIKGVDSSPVFAIILESVD